LVYEPLTIVDGKIPVEGAIALPKADLLIPAVSLASIIAKGTRDRIMTELSKVHPGYGFENHFGYGTPEHQAALEKLGPCSIHRRSYAPIARMSRPKGYTLEDIFDLIEENESV